MAIEIKCKSECAGCGACANICPKKCIRMKPDESGFLYPDTNLNLCVECGLCEKVCPILNIPKKDDKKYENKAFAGWSLSKNIRYNSTSGGMFTELAKTIINDKGYVAGAVYGKNCEIEQRLVSSGKEIECLRQSKYAQSNTKDIFIEVENVLKAGKDVMFCGTPCHIAALKNFLKKKYNNLYLVDFICRGVNSPKAYASYINELETKYGTKVSKVWFKYKKYGWKNSPRCTRIDFGNGKTIIQYGCNNLYMCGYLGPNLYIRPSCGCCKFKGLERNSDITLADFWGISKKLDDNRGTSLVLVNSKKGEKLLNKIKEDVYLEKRNIEEIYNGNKCFESSVDINPKSEEFLSKLDTIPFSILINQYVSISYTEKIVERIKQVIKLLLLKLKLHK